MIKKNIVIFFDCHGNEIYKYLEMNNNVKEIYNIIFISINDYIP
jgi:hypothetical protein